MVSFVRMTRHAVTIAVITLAALTQAQAQFGPATPVITFTTTDFTTTPKQLAITGTNFGTLTTPIVTLNGFTLQVGTFTDTSIVAFLPANITPGTYLLQVSNTSSHR